MTALLVNSFDATAARRRCVAYRRRILDLSQQVSALHVAPAFSCLEMVDVIYHGLMRRSGDGKTFRDGFVMSKGHGCVAQYIMLEEEGMLGRADLDSYCKLGGRLGAHPDYGVPGIEASTGSLGHGLGIATGMAYAERLLRTGRRVHAIISDGELQEGSTWEAIVTAANLGCDNLVAFLDLNDFSGLDRMSEVHKAFYPVADKIRAFGWEAAEVDGHDADAMFDAVTSRSGGKPFMLIGRTVKGKGISFMEHVPIWHYRSPNKEEYAQAMAELQDARA
jgi:transketolase